MCSNYWLEIKQTVIENLLTAPKYSVSDKYLNTQEHIWMHHIVDFITRQVAGFHHQRELSERSPVWCLVTVALWSK